MKSRAGLAGAGVLIGVPLAIYGTRVAASFIHVAGERAAAFAVSAVIMAAVALVATYVPARRAVRVEPMVVLREE